VHPEQPHFYADKFNVPFDLLELIDVPVLVHGVHGGLGVHELHSEQRHALRSASRTTSCLC
jgi:hypothetical protein